MKQAIENIPGQVHCPICTHSVNAKVVEIGRGAKVIPGQKCPRCASALDAGVVLQVLKAA